MSNFIIANCWIKTDQDTKGNQDRLGFERGTWLARSKGDVLNFFFCLNGFCFRLNCEFSVLQIFKSCICTNLQARRRPLSHSSQEAIWHLLMIAEINFSFIYCFKKITWPYQRQKYTKFLAQILDSYFFCERWQMRIWVNVFCLYHSSYGYFSISSHFIAHTIKLLKYLDELFSVSGSCSQKGLLEIAELTN